MFFEHCREIYDALPLEYLQDDLFQRDSSRYYCLIYYPPVKAMDCEEISFHRLTSKDKRLYIHVPFCSGPCTYCNYKKIDARHRRVYIDYVLKELDLLKNHMGDFSVNSLSFGGGSPSLLTLEELQYLYRNLRNRVEITGFAYMIFEIHPEMAHDPQCEQKLQFLKEIGVKRVNIGAQSFNDGELKKVNRRHTGQDTVDMVNLCKKYEFDFINLDLILFLPGQTPKSWLHTLKSALALLPSSISPYFCWMKPTSPIYRQFKKNRQLFPSREDALLMTIMYMELFKRDGYRFATADYFYKPAPEKAKEIANNDFGCYLHTDNELIGTGVASYGYINGSQYMNYPQIEDYFKAIDSDKLPVWRHYTLPQEEEIRHNLMFSLKYDNINAKEFERRYRIDIFEHFALELETLQKKKLLSICGKEVKLTYTGKIFADEMCTYLISDRVKRRIAQTDASDAVLETFNHMIDI